MARAALRAGDPIFRGNHQPFADRELSAPLHVHHPLPMLDLSTSESTHRPDWTQREISVRKNWCHLHDAARLARKTSSTLATIPAPASRLSRVNPGSIMTGYLKSAGFTAILAISGLSPDVPATPPMH